MSEAFNLFALTIVAVLALCGIWSRELDDNLLQRVGLAVVCFGASMRLFTLMLGDDLPATRFAVTYGAAIFAIGTAWRILRKGTRPRNQRKDDPT